MTPPISFVFYLSTAEEEMVRFIGEQAFFMPVSSPSDYSIVPPGVYRVQDGQLLRVSDEPSSEDAALEKANAEIIA